MLVITVGRYYVDRLKQSARQVVGLDAQTVHFVSYHLDTGQSDGHPYQCSRTHFLRWADHEASLNEMDNLQSRLMGYSH